MGGVRVNKDGQAYGLAGLFAAGEAACWDMHGFNRLGGNSLAETIVAGRLVGQSAARYASGADLDISASLAMQAVDEADARATSWLERSGSGPSVYVLRDAMAEAMLGKVGIFREHDGLVEAVDKLKQLLADCDRAVLRSKAPGANPELTFALRLKGMLRLALVTAMGALARCESRGAHFRSDYPLRDDAKWLNRTLAHWPIEGAEPDFSYERVGLLDVPPGHRGYGRTDRIDMRQSVDDYNADVTAEQNAHGRIDTVKPLGSEMQWGAWGGQQ